ncbi:Fcf1-domain-containing protein [Pyronema domesticum]|nr:Fcf1-domain-containing protein [Pyronema domesticum]
MRGKRSKAYKKLMGAYHQTFGFREPYQVLLDSEMVKEATKCTMEIPAALERTLRGKVKPMITQCSIRHLYKLSSDEHPNRNKYIDIAKTFERRRCNHHELEEPLPEKECIESVSLKNGQNKHKYVIAAQDKDIKHLFKEVPGAPTIIIKRSVMLLEPMNEISKRLRDRSERDKFKKGIVDARSAVKRKREDDEMDIDERSDAEGEDAEGEDGDAPKPAEEKKKKKKKGPKGPNPLSVRKKKTPGAAAPAKPKPAGAAAAAGGADAQAKKKRKRKHTSGKAGEGASESTGASESAPAASKPAPAAAATETA